MYIVRDKKGNVVVIASRKEDALAVMQAGPVDNERYTMEEVNG